MTEIAHSTVLSPQLHCGVAGQHRYKAVHLLRVHCSSAAKLFRTLATRSCCTLGLRASHRFGHTGTNSQAAPRCSARKSYAASGKSRISFGKRSDGKMYDLFKGKHKKFTTFLKENTKLTTFLRKTQIFSDDLFCTTQTKFINNIWGSKSPGFP